MKNPIWSIRRVCILLFVAAAALLAGWWFKTSHDQRQGEIMMERLLKGDRTVSIRELDVQRAEDDRQFKDRVILDDLAYAIGQYATPSKMGGGDCEATFYFEGGAVFHTPLGTWRNGFSFSLPSRALEEGFPTHDINVPDNAPTELRMFCTFIDGPSPHNH
jgi:hypothetical protein